MEEEFSHNKSAIGYIFKVFKFLAGIKKQKLYGTSINMTSGILSDMIVVLLVQDEYIVRKFLIAY